MFGRIKQGGRKVVVLKLAWLVTIKLLGACHFSF